MSRRRDLQSGDRVMFRTWFRLAGTQDERMTDEHITLEINHVGYFQRLPDGSKKYKVERTNLSGGVCWVDGIDPDLFSWTDMCNLAYELGYRRKPIAFHLKLPRTTNNEGWVYFKSDSDAYEMIKLYSKKKKPTIPVYITCGGVRQVQDAMDDELGINPPRPLDWRNPLCEQTREELIAAERVANVAAIQLHSRKLPKCIVAQPSSSRPQGQESNKVVEDNVEELEPLWDYGSQLPNVSQFIDEIGTQSGVNSQQRVNEGHGGNLYEEESGFTLCGSPLKKTSFSGRKKHKAGKKKQPRGHQTTTLAEEDKVGDCAKSPASPCKETLADRENTEAGVTEPEQAGVAETEQAVAVEEEFSEEQNGGRPPTSGVQDCYRPVVEEGAPFTHNSVLSEEDREGFEQVFAHEERESEENNLHEWFYNVNSVELEHESADVRDDLDTRKENKKVPKKQPAHLKKSHFGRKETEVVNERRYSTRNKGKKTNFESQSVDAGSDSDSHSDSSDESFYLDEDYNLEDEDDDAEFNENVAGGETVEEASEMGYGGEVSDDEYASDALSSIDGSDGEYDEQGNRLSRQQRRDKRVKTWNRQVDILNPQFALGQLFPNHQTFREAIREYQIRTRRGIYFHKNQWKKIEIKCQPGCNFYIGAALQPTSGTTIQIRTYRPEHTCTVKDRSPFFTYNRVAAEIKEQLFADPNWSLQGIQETLQRKYQIHIPMWTIQHGRNKAKRMNEGHYLDQYNLLYSYRHELKKKNPNTTCEILCDHEDGVAIFKRIYICYGALKEGWKRGCRRLIGLDGTHLKGQHTGQILAAVGIDGNNGMYPIAFAVVETENTETWTWFLEFLQHDLGLDESYMYTFMSDKQKGLGNAIRSLFPDAEHRHCVRHLYSNFKLAGNSGEGLKQTVWNAARVARPEWYNKIMCEMQEQSQAAWDWFHDPLHEDRSPIHWSRSHFRLTSGCDLLINNICEVFNGSIVTARSKPILTMLEMIKLDLMSRMANRRVAVEKWKHECGPRIVKQIQRTAEWTHQWKATMAGQYNYQVQGGLHNTMHVVDLRAKTCDCRKWELSGIPCVHAICALRSRNWEPTAFVHDNLKKETYLMAYNPIIMPISDKTLWEPLNIPLAPPPRKKQVARPPTKRRPSAGENLAPPAPSVPKAPTVSSAQPNPNDPTKLSRKGMKMTCTKCKKQGHNKAKCPLNPNPTVQGIPGGSNKRKRPVKHTTASSKEPKSTAEVFVRSRASAKKARMLAAEKAKKGAPGTGPSTDGATF